MQLPKILFKKNHVEKLKRVIYLHQFFQNPIEQPNLYFFFASRDTEEKSLTG